MEGAVPPLGNRGAAVHADTVDPKFVGLVGTFVHQQHST